jgi:hypothetical protein
LGTVNTGLDWGIWRGVATATIQAFLRLLTEAITRPARVEELATNAGDPDTPRVPPEPETP